MGLRRYRPTDCVKPREDIAKYPYLNVEQLQQELQRIQYRGLELTAQMRECNDPERKIALKLEALNWVLRATDAEAEISYRRLDATKKERKQQLEKEAREQHGKRKGLRKRRSRPKTRLDRAEILVTSKKPWSEGADTVEKTMEYYITQEELPEEGGNTSMAPPEQLSVPLHSQQDHDATKIRTEISKSQRMQSGDSFATLDWR